MHLRYLTRGRGEVSERDVSPQRLVHYRNTWYLDAWCHRATALRRFALDAIEEARAGRTRPTRCRWPGAGEMDAGYGIYAGGRRRWATLRFERRPRMGQPREWHPEQNGRWLRRRALELRLPYVDDTELVMDILRQGEQVQVLAPRRWWRRCAGGWRRGGALVRRRRAQQCSRCCSRVMTLRALFSA